MSYCEDDYLDLAGIQHFEFCRRQWALIHIEQQWAENVRTIAGNIMHAKAHDGKQSEKRGNILIIRGLQVSSSDLGISGICDVVEFHADSNGVTLYNREGKYTPFPVEYKRGNIKPNDMDRLQLTAQAMCLEEMLCCSISKGSLFYGEIKHREEVTFTDELRNHVRKNLKEMHQYYQIKYTPKVKISKACNACSLKDICLPILNKDRRDSVYISERIKESDNENNT